MEVRFSMEEISGCDMEEFSVAARAFAKQLELARKDMQRTKQDAQEVLNASLCILVAKLHERVVYLEQFAPSKKTDKDQYQ